MRPGLTGVLLITVNVVFVFPSPINYLENNNAVNKNSSNNSEPPVCVFGFEFNATDKECHLAFKLSGKVDKNNIDLFIACPSGYTYSGSGKFCKERENRRVIDTPIVCSSNAKIDPNGNCRDPW